MIMSTLKRELTAKFGEDSVVSVPPKNDGDFPLLLISLPMRSGIQVLVTDGLADYKMPVPERYKERSRNEIYFCLPSYWDLSDESQSQFMWVITWLQKLAKHAVNKQTWFGPGHTIPTGNPAVPLSVSMKQDHFILVDPILLEEVLSPLKLDTFEERIYFLGALPIFGGEVDYKMGKGTYKFLQKLTAQGTTELLDDFRGSCLRSKWRLSR
jgi:hypothetical protein